MIIRLFSVICACFLLGGCFSTGMDFKELSLPTDWFKKDAPEKVDMVEAQTLKEWWKRFEDPALDGLIALALQESPQRRIAEARIVEACGLKRTAFSALLPQIGGSAEKGRQDTQFNENADFYSAQFDASFELDIFGKNRNANNAASARIQALEAEYHDVTLTLVADVARTYIEYRSFQDQARIGRKNLDSQEKTLELITNQQKAGEATGLDVNRASNLVNTTRASIPEFERQAENAALRLSVLTGNLPEEIQPILMESAPIPGASVQPVLMAPAKVIAMRPDIRAAQKTLQEQTNLAESVTAEFFPSFTLRGFFGIEDNALASSATVWSLAAGTAVALLDFGRIEGRIDAARAREVQAYEAYRATYYQAITDVETALNDYAQINQRRLSLRAALDDAQSAFNLSDQLFKEGEISFLDVLDAQRQVNAADSALASAEAAQAEALVRLYKSLGVY